jgi:hypothetical protein
MGKRGQAALEFLMTYGWALLVVLVAIGALAFFFGWDTIKLSLIPDTCFLGPGLFCSDISGDEGSLGLVVMNSMGKNLREFEISTDLCGTSSGKKDLNDGDQKSFFLSNCNFEGQEIFEGELSVSYQFAESSIDHAKTGNVKVVLNEGDSQGGGGGGPGSGGSGYNNDGDTVFLLNFNEDTGEIITDSSSNGFVTTYIGNTELLMHLDDGSLEDESGNNNDGSFIEFDNAILLMNLDHTFGTDSDDSSNYNNDGVISGDVSWTSDGKTSYGLDFPGNVEGAYLRIPFSSSLRADFFTKPTWAVEFWIKPSLTGSSTQDIFCGISNGDGYKPRIWLDTYGKLHLGAKVGGDFGEITSTDNGVLEAGEWRHVVLSSDGTNYKFYVDGVEEASASVLQIDDSVDTYSFGSCNWNNRMFRGVLDEIAIYKRNLRDDEAIAHFNRGRAEAQANFVESNYGDAIIFDDDDDYIKISDNPSLDINDKMTIAFWANIQSQNNYWEDVVTKGSSGNRFIEIPVPGTNAIWARFDAANGMTANNAWSADDWIHIAYTTDRITPLTELYINGEYKDERGSSVLPVPSGNFKFGTINAGESFNGLIDEFLICSRVLSASQITELKNNGEAKSCDWVNGVYNSALDFDGHDDIVEFTSVGSLDITQNLTVEAWVKPSDGQSTQWPNIINKNDVFSLSLDCGSSPYNPPCDIIWSVHSGSVQNDVIADVDIGEGEWSHVAATFNGTRMTIYVGGDNVANKDLTFNNVDVPGVNTISISSSSNPFKGAIDDVRVSDVVRY